jgi:hypothetical protein
MLHLPDIRSWRGWPELRRQYAWTRFAGFLAATVAALLLFTLSYIYLREPGLLPPFTDENAGQTIDNGVGHEATGPTVSNQTDDHEDGPAVTSQLVPAIKPAGVKIAGVVFYGRRDRSSILECYLRQNLASNGGWLDEIIWAINTDVEEDVGYAEDMVPTHEDYRFVRIPNRGYASVYEATFTEEETVYVKIDDDVVFVDQHAIPRMVTTLLNRPDAFVVLANTVNNPAFGWVHYHLGAVRPYLPELAPDQEQLATRENGVWKASDLPTWTGTWTVPKLDEFHKLFEHDTVPKHRWLPTRDDKLLYHTPAAESQYSAWGNNLHHWPLAAQAHYSLLEHLENDELSRYYMSHGGEPGALGAWNMRGERVSINFIAVRGRDIVQNMESLSHDDEHQLTVALPEQQDRRKP